MTIIERFRTELEWSQEHLAHRLGVSRQLVGMWESGERLIRPVQAHEFLTVAAAHGHSYSLDDVYPAPDSGS